MVYSLVRSKSAAAKLDGEAAGAGVVFLVGRFLYRSEYLKDPAGRSPGFALTFLPSAVMAIWLLVVAIRNLL